MVILLSQLANLLTSLLTGRVPPVQLPMLAAMVVAGITGGSLSASLSKKISIKRTDRLFLGMLVMIFLVCVYNMFRLRVGESTIWTIKELMHSIKAVI